MVASTVNDINRLRSTWNLLGFLDDYERSPINGIPVIGQANKETISKLLLDEEIYFYWSLVSVKGKEASNSFCQTS